MWLTWLLITIIALLLWALERAYRTLAQYECINVVVSQRAHGGQPKIVFDASLKSIVKTMFSRDYTGHLAEVVRVTQHAEGAPSITHSCSLMRVHP